MNDGPGGVSDDLDGVTQFPAPVALAASWNRKLARRYGAAIGEEERGKGVDVDLGPTINLVRDPRWGRAFETYSEDPYLSSQIAIADVQGVQSTGTLAQLKHLALYNQETNRNTSADNVIIDTRTMHELYLRQFGEVIAKAHPASIMCSYNLVNGVRACEDPYLLHKLLRQQFGYRGFVTSDWGGTHSTLASARAGLNVEMPDGKYYGKALKRAVAAGAISADTIDALVRPLLAAMFRYQLFTRKRSGTPSSKVTTPAHVHLARQVAEQGAVLLKNAHAILPLSTAHTRSIAVIGADAGEEAVTSGGGSAHVNAGSIVTPVAGITARAGKNVRVRYAQGSVQQHEAPVVPAKYLQPESGSGYGLSGRFYAGISPTGKPVAMKTTRVFDLDWHGSAPAKGLSGDHWSARWTGTLTPPASGPYEFTLTSDDGSRLYIDGKLIVDNWGDHASLAKHGTVSLKAGRAVPIRMEYYQSAGGSSLRLGWRPPGGPSPKQTALLRKAVALAKSSDVAVVFASDFESEGSDLSDIRLPGTQARVIAAVAKANPNTIVVLNTGSAVAMPWLDSVAAVIEAWYPGEQDGNAIAALLFGDVNPSGKLPVTFPRRLADVPAASHARWPGIDGHIHYSEGLEVGYRWYDAKGITPLFAFGHGLSYTHFDFSHLKAAPKVSAADDSIHVTLDVTNTGHRRGADVVQLYVHAPDAADEPPKQLQGFQRIDLAAGESATVAFDVPVRQLAIWDSDRHGWRVVPGTYRFMAGDASDHLPLDAEVRVAPRH
jgi:beta-glucosidase